MAYYTRLSRRITAHSDGVTQSFDPARSNSHFPMFYCCSRCEHDWVANRLQALTLTNAVDIRGQV